MKRAATTMCDGNDAGHVQWLLDASVRLAVFVPTDPHSGAVEPGMRSVYYVPRGAHGAGTVMDGLGFELYALVEDNLNNATLEQSLLSSYLWSNKVDREFPDSPWGEALRLVEKKTDTGLLSVYDVPASVPAYDYVGFHEEAFDDPATGTRRIIRPARHTRLVGIATRSHAVLLYLVQRYAFDEELVRNRDRPNQSAHAFYMLYLAPTPGKKKEALPRRMRPVRETLGFHVLIDQLRLAIDAIEVQRVRDREERRQLALEAARRGEGNAFYTDLDALPDAGVRDENAAGQAQRPGMVPKSAPKGKKAGVLLNTQGSRMYAAVDAGDISYASGFLMPARYKIPAQIRGIATIDDVDALFGKKPTMLRDMVPAGAVQTAVAYAQVRVQRTLGNNTTPVAFYSHDRLFAEYHKNPRPAPPMPSRKHGKIKTTKPDPVLSTPDPPTVRRRHSVHISSADLAACIKAEPAH